MFFFIPETPIPEGLSIYLIGNAALNFHSEVNNKNTIGFQFRRNQLSKKCNTTYILTEEHPFFGRKYDYKSVKDSLEKSLFSNNWKDFSAKNRLHMPIFDPSELFSATTASLFNNKLNEEGEIVLPVILSPILDSAELTNDSVSRYLSLIDGEKTYILCSDPSKLKAIEEVCEEMLNTQAWFQSAIQSKLEAMEGVEFIKQE